MSAPFPVIQRIADVGSGSTGRVWRGVLSEPFEEWPAGTSVAVKALHPELCRDPRARAAFENEAAVGSRVRAPGLVRILWAGEGRGEDGTPAGPELVMLYVPGRTLSDVLAERGPLPEPLLRSVAAQVAGGLAALHEAGYVHGDVKPENMRLDAAGRAVLTDLGFARAAELRAPGEHERAGSLAYLSPERIRGHAASPAGDVFALGLVIYELATGRHPFADAPRGFGISSRLLGVGGGVALQRAAGTGGVLLAGGAGSDGKQGEALLAAIAAARYVPPSRRAPWLSPLLDRLLREVLAHDPALRPPAREVQERLQLQEAGPWWRTHLDEEEVGTPGTWYMTPLVGRERELGLLRAVWNETLAGRRGHVVWLAGAAGSGKTRLVSDFADRVRTTSAPPVFLQGRCRTLVAQRPCSAVLELLQRWLGLPPGAAPGERERAVLARSAPPSAALALFQALDPDYEADTAGAVPTALADWLVSLARRVPVLVSLADTNFADEGTLLVLTLVAERLVGARLLIVLGEREHEPPENPEALERLRERLAGLGARRVTLAPLERRAVLELVNRLFHHTVARRRVAEALWSKSHGNAALLVEILRELMDGGRMLPVLGGAPSAPGEPGRFSLSIAPEEIPLPRSLGTLINDRFRRLTLLERAWLRRLSVVGGRLEPEFLERAFPETSAAEMSLLLARFVDAGWLEPAGERFRFARPVLRESVYRSMARADRVSTHLAAASALAPDAEGRIQLLPALQRAYHLHAAGEHEALLRALPPLIEAMLKRGQPQRVVTLAGWGLEALAQIAPSRVAPSRVAPGRVTERLRLGLLEAAADAADRLGRRGQQRAWLDQLSDAELPPDEYPAELARVYLLHGRYSAATGHYGLARGMFRNAVELARRATVSDELESEALRRLAAVQAHVGELAEARQLAAQALDKAAHDAQRAVTWLQCGVIELLEDEFEAAFRAADRALALLRVENEWRLPGIGAAAHMLRGRTYRVAGRPRRAFGAMKHALRLARQAGERRLEAEISARLGGLLLDVDRVSDAETRMRDALLISRDIEDRRGETLAGLWLGILLWEQDDPEARRQIDRVIRQAREIGLGRVEALALAIRARMHRAAGRLAAALGDSDRATEQLALRGAELADRIVIEGTRVLILEDVERAREARELARRMERNVRRVNQRIKNPVTRRRHADFSRRLLRAVLDREGVIYPRLRDEAPEGAE